MQDNGELVLKELEEDVSYLKPDSVLSTSLYTDIPHRADYKLKRTLFPKKDIAFVFITLSCFVLTDNYFRFGASRYPQKIHNTMDACKVPPVS